MVLLDTEHPNQVYGWLALRERGVEVRRVRTAGLGEGGGGDGDGGRIDAVDAETLRPYVDHRTRAIGLSTISFDAGQRHDVAGISAAFGSSSNNNNGRDILVLADLTQHVGFAPVDVQRLGVAAAAFSLHKGLNCPTGLGALYVSPAAAAAIGSAPPPIVSMSAVKNLPADLVVRGEGGGGWGEVELREEGARRFEHANLSLLGVVAAQAYLRFYLEVLGPEDVEAHLCRLTGLLARECGRLGIPLLGPREAGRRAPHICVLGLDPEGWGAYLRELGGVRVTVNRLGLRVSFGFYNSVRDVTRFVGVLERGLAKGLSVR